MGSSDNFCLRWNDFESNISTSFRELRQDSEFFDVTLCCDNGTDVVQAHKVILAACSPLFRKILAHQKHTQNPFLYLKGIKLKELQAVLNFMYHGEVNVAQDALNNFLAVAEELAVKGLTTDGKSSTNSESTTNDQRKKAVPAKRKSSLPPATAPNAGAAKKAKPTPASHDDDDDDVVEELDVKRIKAEPEPSGSNVPLEAEEDSYAGDEVEANDFGEGEDFDSFAQYGDDFDDSSLGAPGGSGTATDSKGRKSQIASKTGELVCMDCGYYSLSKAEMNLHNVTMHPKICSLQCKFCSKAYPNEQSLKRHFNQTHLGKGHSTKLDLGLIMSVHFEPEIAHEFIRIEENGFMCNLCHFSCKKNLNALVRHIKSAHFEGDIICRFCSKMCNSMHSLFLHIYGSHKRPVMDLKQIVDYHVLAKVKGFSDESTALDPLKI